MDSENKIDEFLAKYKYSLALGLVGLVLLIGGIFSSGLWQKLFIKSTYSGSDFKKNSTESYVKPAAYIKVDVEGAVQKPGVYSLNSSARIEEAIAAAGGVTEEADADFLTKNINLAQKLSDGTKIYLPKKGESLLSNPAIAGASASITQTQMININLASVSELESLPGIGAVTVQKIISQRPYQSLEELVIKKVVSRATFNKIKDRISVY